MATDSTLLNRGAEILNGSPLGKYAEAVTAAIALIAIVSAIGFHVIEGVIGQDFDTAFVDNIALIAAGVLFGSRAVTNGAKEAVKEPIGELARDVAAVHTRLDQLDMPPTAAANTEGNVPE